MDGAGGAGWRKWGTQPIVYTSMQSQLQTWNGVEFVMPWPQTHPLSSILWNTWRARGVRPNKHQTEHTQQRESERGNRGSIDDRVSRGPGACIDGWSREDDVVAYRTWLLHYVRRVGRRGEDATCA